MDYPKYQVSRMDGEYQVVYRTDKVEEFADMLAGIKKLEIKPKVATPVAPVTPAFNMTADQYESRNDCPKCGAPLKAMNTQSGKNALKCSTNKWDKVTKTASGCDYIKWL